MGVIVPEKAAKTSSGKDKGTIEAVFDWKDTGGKTLLTETRSRIANVRLFRCRP